MSKTRILYAEDDETLAFLTKDNLEQNNYDVFHCQNGKNCLAAFRKETFDICVFDIMLPGMDGFELTTAIRKIDPHIPILFLSSKILKEDRIHGLRLGADDYLVKPFSIEELLLKIEIFLKRSKKNQVTNEGEYELGDYRFLFQDLIIIGKSQRIVLTQREAELLKLFLDNKNKVLKREEILKTIWGTDDYFMGRSLDVFISRLRKILSAEKSVGIDNLHGIGFRLTERK